MRAAIGIKIYGNDCGPGHNGNDFKLPPIDVLEAGCREHDRCFKGMGYRKNCKCNKNLIDYIDRHYNRMSKGAKWTAQVIRGYFSTAGQLGC